MFIMYCRVVLCRSRAQLFKLFGRFLSGLDRVDQLYKLPRGRLLRGHWPFHIFDVRRGHLLCERSSELLLLPCRFLSVFHGVNQLYELFCGLLRSEQWGIKLLFLSRRILLRGRHERSCKLRGGNLFIDYGLFRLLTLSRRSLSGLDRNDKLLRLFLGHFSCLIWRIGVLSLRIVFRRHLRCLNWLYRVRKLLVRPLPGVHGFCKLFVLSLGHLPRPYRLHKLSFD